MRSGWVFKGKTWIWAQIAKTGLGWFLLNTIGTLPKPAWASLVYTNRSRPVFLGQRQISPNCSEFDHVCSFLVCTCFLIHLQVTQSYFDCQQIAFGSVQLEAILFTIDVLFVILYYYYLSFYFMFTMVIPLEDFHCSFYLTVGITCILLNSWFACLHWFIGWTQSSMYLKKSKRIQSPK